MIEDARLKERRLACSIRFPLIHVDYGHNGTIVDTEDNMLGVIDFENAIVAPWTIVEYPLTVRATPVLMDLPSDYSLGGFLQEVVDAERELGMPPKLSGVLSNGNIRDIAVVMKLFAVDGKMG